MGDSVVSIAAALRRSTETVSSRPLRGILKVLPQFLKAHVMNHRKKVGGAPSHIEGRHESMSLNEGRGRMRCRRPVGVEVVGYGRIGKVDGASR